VAGDVTPDLAAAGRAADERGVRQVERGGVKNERRQRTTTRACDAAEHLFSSELIAA
jgi:hypothetical protein